MDRVSVKRNDKAAAWRDKVSEEDRLCNDCTFNRRLCRH